MKEAAVKILKIFFCFFIFLIMPISFAFYTMKPILQQQRLPIPVDDKESTVQINIKETPLHELGKVFLGTPLRLNWYVFCLHNENQVSINGTKIQLPYEKDPEAGAMEIEIKDQGESVDKIYSSITNEVCKLIRMENLISSISAIKRKPEVFTIESFVNPSIVETDKGQLIKADIVTQVHTDNSYITFKHYWKEFVFKLIVIIITWLLIVSNLISLLEFCNKNKKIKATSR